MTKSKKLIAVMLALILCLSAFVVPVAAASAQTLAIGGGSTENFFNLILDRLVTFILKFLNKFWPGYEDDWQSADDYVSENFYVGEDKFDNTVDPNAKWSVGYAGASLLEGIEPMSGEYYMAGSLEVIQGRVPTEIHDDQRVRVYAISDGVSGTVVHAVLDGFGFSRQNVLEIRSRLAEFAAKNNVVSINISVLHQHSCIDTLGMSVPLAEALIFNTGNAATDDAIPELTYRMSEKFLENVFTKTVSSIKKAVKDMRVGTLSFGTVDVSDYIHDKREPIVFDGNLNRLRFVPEDGSKETWIVEGGIHCVGLGAGTDELTADYPYYMEKYINKEANANLVYIQGAELAITSDYAPLNLEQGGKGYDNLVKFGTALGEKVCGINNDVALDPVLNIKHKELFIKVDNQVLTLASREDILDAVIVKSGDNEYKLVTEIGYMELGNTVAVFLTPGELDPVIIWGGATTAEESWTGETWDYAPLADFTDGKTCLVFGLCNDHAGYIMTDNEYRSIIDNNEEIFVISEESGASIAQGFMDLIASTK